MPLLVKLSTTLRQCVPEYDPHAGLNLEARPGETVAELFGRINIPAENVKVIMVNGVQARADTTLEDGDRVGLFPPVGGG